MRRVCAIGACILSSGCSTVIEGRHQQILLNTNPPAAECGLYRQGVRIATVPSTPSSALIEKTKHDIWVVCVKQGYQQAAYYNRSGAAGATLGNIILGGGIGWAIDSATGSDNKYDSPVNLSLVPAQAGQAEGPAVLPSTFAGSALPASAATATGVTSHQGNAAPATGTPAASVDAPPQNVVPTAASGNAAAQSSAAAPAGFDGQWVVELKLAASNYSGGLLSCPDSYELPLQFANRSAEGPWGKLRFTTDVGDFSGWMEIRKSAGERQIIVNLAGHLEQSQVTGTITGSCIGTFRMIRR